MKNSLLIVMVITFLTPSLLLSGEFCDFFLKLSIDNEKLILVNPKAENGVKRFCEQDYSEKDALQGKTSRRNILITREYEEKAAAGKLPEGSPEPVRPAGFNYYSACGGYYQTIDVYTPGARLSSLRDISSICNPDNLYKIEVRAGNFLFAKLTAISKNTKLYRVLKESCSFY